VQGQTDRLGMTISFSSHYRVDSLPVAKVGQNWNCFAFFLVGKVFTSSFTLDEFIAFYLEEKIEQTIQVAVVLHYLHADRKQPH
jgi:hypothetical protein